MSVPSQSRPRLSRACARCAKRKLGCDKVRPRCGRCTRDQAGCEYASAAHARSNSVTFIDETPNLRLGHGRSTLSSRLQRVGELLTATPANHGTALAGSFGENSNSSDDTDEVQQDAGHLFLGAQSKSQYLSPTFFASIREELPEIEVLVRSQRRRSARVSRTTFASLSDSSSFMDDWKSKSNDDERFYGDLFPPAAKRSSPAADEIGNHYDRTLKQVIHEMPSLLQQDILIRAYIHGCHTVNPVFNVVVFMDQVRVFHSRISKDTHPVNAHFLALLSAVLFAGAVVADKSQLTEAFPHTSRDALVLELYHLAIRAMRVSGYPQAPSIHSFSAFLIANTALLRDEDPLANCSFIGTAFRIAQMLGLHRDPSTFPRISPVDAQVRRQLWFNLVAVDAQVAFASGLPPLIESKIYDVSPVSETSDADLCAGVDVVEGNQSMIGIFTAGKINFYRHASEFLHVLHSNVITHQRLHEILQVAESIEREMDIRIASISELGKARLESPDTARHEDEHLHQAEFDPSYAQFAIIVLSMLAAKPYAIMYGPLRKHKLLGELDGLRSRAYMNCRKHLLLFLQLTQQQHFQPWHWCWPGQHQPFHSIMALITHLDEFPHDPAAAETRKLVDLAFYMCRDDLYGGIVADDGGEYTDRLLSDDRRGPWRLVRSARDRVWERAGLDSNVLLCPSRAEDIQFADIERPDVPEPETGMDCTGEAMEMPYFLDEANIDLDFLNDLSDPVVTLATPDGLF